MLGDTGPCAKFQLDGMTGSGSFLTSVFPPAEPKTDRQRERERERERDGREVNIRDLIKQTRKNKVFDYKSLIYET